MLSTKGIVAAHARWPAVSLEPLFLRAIRRDQSFLAQEKHARSQRRIGELPPALITAGETIAVNAGTKQLK